MPVPYYRKETEDAWGGPIRHKHEPRGIDFETAWHLFTGFFTLLILAGTIGVIYVAYHFISKYW